MVEAMNSGINGKLPFTINFHGINGWLKPFSVREIANENWALPDLQLLDAHHAEGARGTLAQGTEKRTNRNTCTYIYIYTCGHICKWTPYINIYIHCTWTPYIYNYMYIYAHIIYMYMYVYVYTHVFCIRGYLCACMTCNVITHIYIYTYVWFTHTHTKQLYTHCLHLFT